MSTLVLTDWVQKGMFRWAPGSSTLLVRVSHYTRSGETLGLQGGEWMKDYKLTVEVLEARIAPAISQGGQ